jgi:hypothetical protein
MPSYELTAAHQLMIAKLQALIEGKIKRLAIVAPPRHGKTNLANILVPAFAFGRDPQERIISVSYGSSFPKPGAGA